MGKRGELKGYTVREENKSKEKSVFIFLPPPLHGSLILEGRCMLWTSH